MSKYLPNLNDVVEDDEKKIELRIQGPVQQNRGSEGYWAGYWTPDEAEALGITLIKAAHDKRKGRSVKKIKMR